MSKSWSDLVKTLQTGPPFSQVFEIWCQNHDRTLVKTLQTEPPFSQVFEICCQNRDRTLVKKVQTEPRSYQSEHTQIYVDLSESSWNLGKFGFPRESRGNPAGFPRESRGIPPGIPRDSLGNPGGFPRTGPMTKNGKNGQKWTKNDL